VNIALATEELIHIAELLRSDIIARRILFQSLPGKPYPDESVTLSKNILIKLTIASIESYDDPEPTTLKPIILSARPDLN
jgi:hypothetical protein